MDPTPYAEILLGIGLLAVIAGAGRGLLSARRRLRETVPPSQGDRGLLVLTSGLVLTIFACAMVVYSWLPV